MTLRAPPTLLRLGDRRLRDRSVPVTDFACASFQEAVRALDETLRGFRLSHGFGRAIAAPQIGIARRFIALGVEGAPPLVVNPEITWRAQEHQELWDDCM